MSLALRVIAWGIASFIAVVLLTQPVSAASQLALSTTVIVVLLGTWFLGRGLVARQLFLALASFVVIRYMYWRITSTVPPISDPLGFSLGTILLVAELYCVVILCISLLMNADPLNRPKLPDYKDEELPTVDVFIPTYNEDEYILATTMAAARSMDYPPDKLTVWLLDDGGTDQKCNDKDPAKADAARQRRISLQALCARMGCVYLTRKRNEHAKAGNMNNGLKYAKGDIIVVFDADHAPFREFLRETVGHFLLDPKLFLVQTPHVFLNPDPIEKNLKTFDRMPSENEMFYGVTQRGLDKWNGSFFCGSAALLRRAALETTGGFSGVTITEDCETAFELHAKGWTSVFVEKPLIAGLQPETFVSFIGQRSRWCQGMMQILMLKNPALKKGLHFIQRICYLSSMTFWFFPIPRLIFMFAPLTHIFFDIKIFVSNFDEAIAYTATYMVVNVMVQNYMFGTVRWPWVSELYEYVQGVFLAKAMVSVAMNPRKPTFNVTAKGLTLDNNHLSELAWPFFAIWGTLFIATCYAFYRYFFEPGIDNLMLVVGIWNTFNLIIAGVGLGAVSERAQPDRHPRLAIARTGRLLVDGASIPVMLRDVSAGGVSLTASDDLPVAPGEERLPLRLEIDATGTLCAGKSLPMRLVGSRRFGAETIYGFEFHDMEPDDYFVLADLMYGDSDALPRFLAGRRKHKNVFAGAGQFIWWGLTEPFRAFRYALSSAKATPADPPAAVPEASTTWLKRFARFAREGAAPEPASAGARPAAAAKS